MARTKQASIIKQKYAEPSKTKDDSNEAKKKRRRDRWKPIRDIKAAQRNTKASKVLPLATINEWIRSIAANDLHKPEIRFAPDAIKSLREAVIEYGTDLLRNANNIAVVARKSPTVTFEDLKLVQSMFAQAETRCRVCV